MQPLPKPPVFIVGAPRSGTTMLAAMLASHPAIAAGPETQFFSKLAGANLEDAARDPDWPELAVELLASLTLADQPVTGLFATDREKLASFLAQQEPSVAAILEALVVPFANAQGKGRWAEKTPNHILHLETIRHLWPQARIIRIIRDPRDVGLSTRKIPTFSNHILPNIYLWREWNAAAEAFLEADPGSITVRYEDIVDDAESQLRRVCDHIDEPFDPNMIAFEGSAKSVSSANESWKGQVADGLTANRKYAWKSDLPTDHRRICDLVCHELLVTHGYEHGPAPAQSRTAFRMSRAYTEQHEAVLLKDAEREVRWLPASAPQLAQRVVDQPEYSRFRDPLLLMRLAWGRLLAKLERLRS